jgi:putative ABC transport system permease protein
MPLGNLWRMKLRSFLTISGVMIAIGAFVAMLSFGAGNQKYITEQYNQLGLLSTMYVYPKTTEQRSDEDEPHGNENNGKSADTAQPAPLNDSVMNWLATLPGVNLAYPFDSYNVTATVLDTALKLEAQSVPSVATQTKMFSQMTAGRLFASDSAREAVVTSNFLDHFKGRKIITADSLLGKTLVVSVERVRLDSGLVHLLHGAPEVVDRVFVKGWIDSVRNAEYLKRLAKNELGQALGRFTEGFFSHPATVADTLTIVGVMKSTEGHSRLQSIIVPVSTSRKFSEGGLSNDPTELYAALSGGGNLILGNTDNRKQYPRVTLQLEAGISHKPVSDTVEAHGYRAFSYAQQFEEISRFFIYFDMALAMVGLIALVTASLGIVNVMVMSIMERRREIGVLKSLGASEMDIKALYLFESALIGLIGSIAGLILGWTISRISSAIAQYYMTKEGFDPIEFFALPWWLILLALGFGLVVSIAAGAYPAARAARVDPIEALRVE